MKNYIIFKLELKFIVYIKVVTYSFSKNSCFLSIAANLNLCAVFIIGIKLNSDTPCKVIKHKVLKCTNL